MVLPIIFILFALANLFYAILNYDLEIKRIHDEENDLWVRLGCPVCNFFGDANLKKWSHRGDASTKRLMIELLFTNRHSWVRKSRLLNIRLSTLGFVVCFCFVCILLSY